MNLGGGAEHSYIGSDQGYEAGMGEFLRPKICGWMYISAVQKVWMGHNFNTVN